MTFKLDPIHRAAYFMILFSAAALATHFTGQVLLHLCATLGLSLLLWVFFTYFSTKRKNVWDTVITGLILFLVLHYGASAGDLIFPIVATTIAMLVKFFVEWKASPIINPVSIGLLMAALILAFVPGLDHLFVSWWGASFGGYISLALMALWMVGGLYQWKKWQIVISFLVAHALLLLLRGQGLEGLQYTFTDSTIYFFVTIMLVEPKTSPFLPKQQVAYGLVAAILFNLLAYTGTPYFELFALVGANLSRVVMMQLPKKKA
jgi:hypothetical protein